MISFNFFWHLFIRKYNITFIVIDYIAYLTNKSNFLFYFCNFFIYFLQRFHLFHEISNISSILIQIKYIFIQIIAQLSWELLQILGQFTVYFI